MNVQDLAQVVVVVIEVVVVEAVLILCHFPICSVRSFILFSTSVNDGSNHYSVSHWQHC